jgi:glycosyltransferase involved in cell wall biosynthesis
MSLPDAREAVPRVSVIVPFRDRRALVHALLDGLEAQTFDDDVEVILVDDGSTDGTGRILAGADWPADGVRVLTHERNRGKGAAVRTALEHATGDFSTIFDADLEYDPEDLKVLLPPLLDGTTNVVFGVRAFDGFTSHSFLYVLGNRSVTLAANVLFNVYLKDLMTMHKAIRTDVFKALPLRESGFAIEPEIAARLVQHGERIYEVPVSYKARATEEGKKLTSADGFRVLRTLLRCRFTRS